MHVQIDQRACRVQCRAVQGRSTKTPGRRVTAQQTVVTITTLNTGDWSTACPRSPHKLKLFSIANANTYRALHLFEPGMDLWTHFLPPKETFFIFNK